MTAAPGWDIIHTDELADGLVRPVRALADAVEASDGAPPLDEQAELRLTRRQDGVEHVVLRSAGETLVGYAQVDHTDPSLFGAEILVGLPANGDPGGVGAGARGDPSADAGRADIANNLLAEVEAVAGGGAVQVWARGDRTPVRGAAEARHYRVVRTLLTMSRPLAGLDTTRRALPAGVSIRPFVPGQDDAAWLAVNARAFAAHPEQGRWTQADLDERIAQPWFDPAGLLLLVDADDTVLGFHWTKRHPASASQPALAEVYVIGMDPSAQGRGLGRTLLLAGLAHLQGPGSAETGDPVEPAETVILYTDEENPGAVHLYLATGFEIFRREVQYRRP